MGTILILREAVGNQNGLSAGLEIFNIDPFEHSLEDSVNSGGGYP